MLSRESECFYQTHDTLNLVARLDQLGHLNLSEAILMKYRVFVLVQGVARTRLPASPKPKRLTTLDSMFVGHYLLTA